MAKPTPPQEPKDQPQEPKRLGGFELLGRLGKGGMGTVLKARQVSMDRLVALKILPKKLAENEAFVQRFLREARSAAKLRHPNIVQAFDAGQSEGYYFFAMEFVDGETLADIVRRDGPLEPNRALAVMKQTASALAAAHEEGIVHRDIKPSNIMLDKKGEVRVTDFGLAKRTEGDVAVTADGAVVGTPAYVAPEMAKGGEADHRSDLYSLGATIFCALAGRPPFEGKNFSEVLIKQVNEAAPPLASLAPRVDRRLCHIIDRLLRKNPEARYQSAKALLDDLEGLGKLQSVAAAARAEGRAMLAEAPTLAMTEGQRRAREAKAARPPASGRRPTTLIAAGVVVGIIAIVALVMALRPSRKPPDTATKPPSSAPQPPTPDPQHPVPPPKPPEVAKKAPPAKPTPPVKKAMPPVEPPKVAPLPEAKPAYALLFNGVDDDVQVPFVEAHRLRGVFTVEARFCIERYPQTSAPIVVKRPPQEGGVGGTFIVRIDGQNLVFFIASAQPTDWHKLPGPRVELGRWYHVALQYDEKRLVAYLDGEKAAELLLKLPLLCDEWPIHIGREVMDRTTFPGRITDVRLWHSLRTEDEIRQNMNRPLKGTEPNLVGYWDFTEGKGDVLHDRTPNNAIGNIRGAKWVALDGPPPREVPTPGRYTEWPFDEAEAKRRQTATAKALGVKAEQDIDLGGGVMMAVVLIPAGDFLMGSPPTTSTEKIAATYGGDAKDYEREFPQHRVTISKPFWLGRLKVTQEQWHAVMGNNPSNNKGNPRNPVEMVSWLDCQEFLRKLSAKLGRTFRLPTEAEWEYACRAGTATEFPYGDAIAKPRPNAWGIHDLHGQLWEWCEDVLQPYTNEPQTDPRVTGPGGFRITRGGSTSDNPGRHRSAYRNAAGQEGRHGNAGLRVLVAAEPVQIAEAPKADGGFALSVIAPVDGVSDLVIAPTGVHWEHRGKSRPGTPPGAEVAAEPTVVNGEKWLPKWQGNTSDTLKVAGMPAAFANLACHVTKVQGRGTVQLVAPAEPQPTQFVVRFADPARGAGQFEARILIGTPAQIARATGAPEPAPPPVAEDVKPAQWQPLFDGKTLAGWKPVEGGAFAGRGKMAVQQDTVVLQAGTGYTGMAFTGKTPKSNYEVELEAMRVEGGRDFCDLCFPVGDAACALVLGGLPQGNLVGLSVAEGDAAPGELTGKRMAFQAGRWYAVRLRVTDERVTAWLDGEKVIDVARAGHTFRLHPDLAPVGGLGVATYRTKAALRNVRLGRLPGAAAEPAEAPKAGEWRDLFDGKTLAGWKDLRAGGGWRVENGEIVGGGRNYPSLATEESFEPPYTLSLEAMGPASTAFASGLLFGVQAEAGKDGRAGYSVALYDLRGHALALMRGFPGDTPGPQAVSQPPGARFPGDQWHKLELVVGKDSVALTCDGQQAFQTKVEHPTAGRIALLARNATRFRNIRLRPGEPPAAPEEGIGPMVIKPAEPLDTAFREANWDVEVDEWEFEGDSVVGDALGIGWMALRGHRLGDYALEVDVTDLGGHSGMGYGLFVRRVGHWQLMFLLSTENKSVGLKPGNFRPATRNASVPGITVRDTGAGQKVQPRSGQRYRLKLECAGTSVRAYVDDALIAEATDNTLLDGDLALFIQRARVRFADLRIRPIAPAVPEAPAIQEQRWRRRADAVAADPRQAPEAKLRVWEDLVERFPKAPAAWLAPVREQRDRWAREVAETLGTATARSKVMERTVFRAPVRELPDGRFRVLYDTLRFRQFTDWEVAAGDVHLVWDHAFCFCIGDAPVNAAEWNYSHGEDFAVSFLANGSRAYGCTAFGMRGQPLDTGLILTVGAENNRATTLGPAGQPPWFRGDGIASPKHQRHELVVHRGELIYRLEDKEVFRRRFDPAAFKGRCLALWSQPPRDDNDTRPGIHTVGIVSAPQPDWVSSVRPDAPPSRRCDRPDAAGWFGLSHPDDAVEAPLKRTRQEVPCGRGFAAGARGGTREGGLRHLQERVAVRDCILTARVEFVGEGDRRGQDGFGLAFRGRDRAAYVAGVSPNGGAEVRRIYSYLNSFGKCWGDDRVADSDDFRTPPGPLHLVAVVRGKRVELFCNGELALVHDKLPEDPGSVGFEVQGVSVLVHDFKWRPLPSDPSYGKLYGEGRPERP